MYAVGVDSGTQSTKVIIVDFDGDIRGRGTSLHRFTEGLKPGESEQHPAVWIEAFEKALLEALNTSGIDSGKIVCLGISGQQHGFVPLDAAGQVIRPAKLWNDTSTVSETDELVTALGGKREYIDKLGINLAVGFTASKILWMKKREPENFLKLSTVLLPHNYLNFVLTGVPHMEFGDASGTGLMDIRNLRWNARAVDAVDSRLHMALPPLSHPKDPVGFIKKDFADHFGMKDVLVSAGGGDNMMAAIGTGNVRPGVCTLSLGTSGTIYAYFDKPFVDPEGEIAAFCDSTGAWLPLLCTMNVTNTSELLKDFMRFSNAELEQAASNSPPGAGHLLFLPFVDGERVPVLPESSGVFFGINRQNFYPSHVSRSVLEGTIFNLGYGFQRMRELGLEPEEIRATGGGAKSLAWLQIAADILNTSVVTLEEDEAAALGGAIQAIWCFQNHKGKNVDLSSLTGNMVKISGREYTPIMKNSGIYKNLQIRFNSLWRTLKEEFKNHRRLME